MFVWPTSCELFKGEDYTLFIKFLPQTYAHCIGARGGREEQISVSFYNCLQRYCFLFLFVITTGLNWCLRAQLVWVVVASTDLTAEAFRPKPLPEVVLALRRFFLIFWLTLAGGVLLVLFSPGGKLCPAFGPQLELKALVSPSCWGSAVWTKGIVWFTQKSCYFLQLPGLLFPWPIFQALSLQCK